MTRFINGRTTVLAGHGFDDATGPYLLVNDVDAREQHRFAVRGRTFSLRRLPRRRCVGRFDLATYEKSCCPLNVELLPDAKETMCPACIEATGFNPSFYYADFVSPQQRAYNLTPHFAYLAYFSPQHVKAGISSETRGIERLLEQGARAARIVGRFSCADEARELEAALCAQPGILETMRASLKTRLLVEERYDPAEAVRVLDERAAGLAEVPAVAQTGFAPEPAQDLSPHYLPRPAGARGPRRRVRRPLHRHGGRRARVRAGRRELRRVREGVGVPRGGAPCGRSGLRVRLRAAAVLAVLGRRRLRRSRPPAVARESAAAECGGCEGRRRRARGPIRTNGTRRG